jgi:hypothetical protein
MAGSYDTYEVAKRSAWRKYAANAGDLVPARHKADSGETGAEPFGLVLSGTIVTYENGGDIGVRPLALQTLEDAIVSGNAGNVADARCFYPADRIDIVAGADTYDEIAFIAGSSADEITATAKAPGDSRLRVDLKDPGGASQPLSVEVVDDGTTIDVTVSLETDGGSAIVSTVAEVIAALNTGDAAAWLFAELSAGTGTETAIDTGPHALVGGALAGDELVSNRNVTDVDKTSDPNVVTFDGAAVDVPAGAVIRGVNVDPVAIAGILEDQIDTIRRRAGENVARDARVTLAIAGHIRTSLIVGWDDSLVPYLAGGEVSSGVLGQGTCVSLAGFVFHP